MNNRMNPMMIPKMIKILIPPFGRIIDISYYFVKREIVYFDWFILFQICIFLFHFKKMATKKEVQLILTY